MGFGLTKRAGNQLAPEENVLMDHCPLGLYGGDTNLYRYVGNDPTNAIDPSGLAEEKKPELHASRVAARPYPTMGGNFYWPLLWNVKVPGNPNDAANDKNGGWVLQHVIITFKVKNRAGDKVLAKDLKVAKDKTMKDIVGASFWKDDNTLDYWEAWRIDPGQKEPTLSRGKFRVVNPNPKDSKDDKEHSQYKADKATLKRLKDFGILAPFSAVGGEWSDEYMISLYRDEANAWSGEIKITGKAYYIDNLVALPSLLDVAAVAGATAVPALPPTFGFNRFNPQSPAGALDSMPTKGNEELITNLLEKNVNNTSGLFEHSITVDWDWAMGGRTHIGPRIARPKK